MIVSWVHLEGLCMYRQAGLYPLHSGYRGPVPPDLGPYCRNSTGASQVARHMLVCTLSVFQAVSTALFV